MSNQLHSSYWKEKMKFTLNGGWTLHTESKIQIFTIWLHDYFHTNYKNGQYFTQSLLNCFNFDLHLKLYTIETPSNQMNIRGAIRKIFKASIPFGKILTKVYQNSWDGGQNHTRRLGRGTKIFFTLMIWRDKDFLSSKSFQNPLRFHKFWEEFWYTLLIQCTKFEPLKNDAMSRSFLDPVFVSLNI